MPRYYPPDRKADALERLQANGGDTLATHFETGIPQRTLYNWRMEQHVLRQTLPPLPQKEFQPVTDATEGMITALPGNHGSPVYTQPLASSPYTLSHGRPSSCPDRPPRLYPEAGKGRPSTPERPQQESQALSPLANWSRWDTVEETVEP